MVREFAPPRRAALTTGLLMTSYHAGGMAATGLGLTLAPAAGWHWVFWAGVPPAVIAVPLLLTLLPEAPGVLLARGGERDRAHAVADRYGLPRPTIVAAPAAGARGHLAAVRALFHPDARWATPLLRLASFCGLLLAYGVSTGLPQMMRASGYGVNSSVSFLLVLEPWPTAWAAGGTSRSSRRGAASSRRHSRYSSASSAAVSAWARASACAQEALTASPSSPRPHTGNPTRQALTTLFNSRLRTHPFAALDRGCSPRRSPMRSWTETRAKQPLRQPGTAADAPAALSAAPPGRNGRTPQSRHR
ncbi:MFS transporter [Streptomyces sp. ME18-1-4]|nr:MFS transporter [Streptomyces sp. ME18-1-4]